MEDISLGSFANGINNLAQDYALPRPTKENQNSALMDAYNVDITDEGSVKQRPGYALISPFMLGHSLASVEGKTFLGIGSQMGIVNDLDPLDMTFLRSGLSGSRIDYVGLAGEVWWSDGSASGRCSSSNIDYPWVLPTPSPPVVGLGTGVLDPGMYRVSISYSSANCGESAATLPEFILLGDEGGLLVTLPTAPSGVETTNIYCTDSNGGELMLFSSVVAATATVFINAAPQGRSLAGRCYLAPLPPGDIVAIHNGRLISASGDMLCYSETYDFGLYQPGRSYLRFPANITIVAPCVGGVYIVADKTYWYAGDDIALAECIEKLPYGATKGTRFDLNDTKAVGWFGANGFVIASTAGDVTAPQEKTFSVPVAATGAVLLRESDGLSVLIASLDDTAAYTSRSSKAFRTRLDETIEDPSTVVMNLSTGATTRYTNFYMTSMCKIGDKYYGVDDAGLHVLEGGKDNLLPIPCEIGFGRYGLRSDVLKHLLNVYIGGIFSDRVELVVRTPTNEHVYTSRGYSDALTVQRIDPGKGLRYTWYDLSLRNVDGYYIELVSVTTKLAHSRRRI